METNDVSVLKLTRESDVQRDPFAHIVADSPLSKDLYNRLVETFPANERFLGHVDDVKSNQAIRLSASQVLEDESFSPEWRAFFRYHTSADFWAEVVGVFGKSLRAKFPDLESRVGRPFEEWRVGRRGGEGDILLDILFVINTPADKPSSVRPPHVDQEKKIFSGLFYMRPDDDPTPGGDLSLFKPLKKPIQFAGHYVDPKAIEEARLIEYGANRFVGFVNSDEALHGVTERKFTQHTRRYINFVAEVPFKAFELQQLPPHRRFLLKMGRKNKSPGVTVS